MIDHALNVKTNILNNILPEHLLYGGLSLEKEGKVSIEDNTFKNLLKKKRGDIVITNRTKYAFLMKLKGLRAILINMNSNHDLVRYKGLKSYLKYVMYKWYYSMFHVVVCLSNVQTKKLRKLGAKNVKVIPLGVDWRTIRKIKLKKDYFLSSGFDQGKNFNFLKKALKNFNLKILDGKKPLPYNNYLQVMGNAKAVVFKLDVNKQSSSDLSGTTTCFEALLMGKPIITNYQPWLKELFKENYYVYNSEDELRKLLNKQLKFKKINYDYLKLDYFTTKLTEVITETLND